MHAHNAKIKCSEARHTIQWLITSSKYEIEILIYFLRLVFQFYGIVSVMKPSFIQAYKDKKRKIMLHTSWRNLLQRSMPRYRGTSQRAHSSFLSTFSCIILINAFQVFVLKLLQCWTTLHQVYVQWLNELLEFGSTLCEVIISSFVSSILKLLCENLINKVNKSSITKTLARNCRIIKQKVIVIYTRRRSAIRVPRPGPSSIRFTLCGCPICSHRHITHTPII